MHEFLIVVPWIGAALVAYGLRRQLGERGREIAAWWGLWLSAKGTASDRRSRGETPGMSERELEELRRRYSEAPADTRAAVMKLLAR